MEDEDPIAAGVPGSHGATRVYDGDAFAVVWDATLCIHTGRCIAAAPQVFDPSRRPWVDPAAGSADTVARAVRRCPTGALQLRTDDPQPMPQPRIEVRPDGPLYVQGDVTVTHADGSTATGQRLALCRCGATGNPPYCDNSHRAVGFTSGAPTARETEPAPPAAAVTVRVPEVGPYGVAGAAVVAPSGEVLDGSGRCSLCRCGKSASKPFCDGSHAGA